MSGGPAPSYLALAGSGELARRVRALDALLAACTVCPWECRVDRRAGETKVCGAAGLPIVASFAPHFGEEPPLSGTHLPRGAARGAGNIFLGHCNLRCVYCQNGDISQDFSGFRRARAGEVRLERLAGIMLELQAHGCHNVGFVSPTHFAPQIAGAVEIAAARGLDLPLVYNTNAYDSLEVLRLLEGVVDIWLPDLKYADPGLARTYSKAPEYVRHARAAVKEMHRQVGSRLVLDERGLVRRGLIVRLLALPNEIAGLPETLRWIAGELGADVAVSVMSQYYPAHKVGGGRYPLLDRKVRAGEWARVLETVDALGFANGWVQPFEDGAAQYYRPDFTDRTAPFRDARDFS